MTTEIEIQVGLKSGMADPEGVNVKKALDLLGFDSVKKVDSVKCYRIITVSYTHLTLPTKA